jgi:hypothetical protein
LNLRLNQILWYDLNLYISRKRKYFNSFLKKYLHKNIPHNCQHSSITLRLTWIRLDGWVWEIGQPQKLRVKNNLFPFLFHSKKMDISFPDEPNNHSFIFLFCITLLGGLNELMARWLCSLAHIWALLPLPLSQHYFLHNLKCGIHVMFWSEMVFDYLSVICVFLVLDIGLPCTQVYLCVWLKFVHWVNTTAYNRTIWVKY